MRDEGQLGLHFLHRLHSPVHSTVFSPQCRRTGGDKHCFLKQWATSNIPPPLRRLSKTGTLIPSMNTVCESKKLSRTPEREGYEKSRSLDLGSEQIECIYCKQTMVDGVAVCKFQHTGKLNA